MQLGEEGGQSGLRKGQKAKLTTSLHLVSTSLGHYLSHLQNTEGNML
jgi:hypothetical protein